MNPDQDLLIRGGLVFDGRGSKPVLQDLGISKGQFVDHHKLSEPHIVEAEGLWVTPGFVDIHTHYDLEVEVNPGLSESVRHGVTTVVMGNCSLSLQIGQAAELADIFQRVETLPEPLVRSWLELAGERPSFEAYFDRLRSTPIGPNVAVMLGHSALRAHVMGLESSLKDRATPAQIASMRALTEEAFEAGCLGLSVDRVHWHKVRGKYAGRALPSHHAGFDEVRALAELCRGQDRVFQVTPNPEQPWSLFQILSLCPGFWRAPLRCTVLSALDMTVHKQLWRLFPAILFELNRVLGANLRFQTLTEPFTIASDGPLTPLFEEFPCGVELNNQLGREPRQALWSDPVFKREFREQWSRGFPKTFDRDLSRMMVLSCPDDSWPGRSLQDIADGLGVDSVELFMDGLERFDDALRWQSTGANQRQAIRDRLVSHPEILPGFSDAGAHCQNLAFYDSALSLLRQAVQRGFMSPERAIQRVTGEAAAWFRLDAGVIEPGARADLLLLDPERLKSQEAIIEPIEIEDPSLSGARRLVKRPEQASIEAVFIGGQKVVERGLPLPALGQRKTGLILTTLKPTSSVSEAYQRFRNRISDIDIDHGFDDYWPVFMLKHRHPANVLCHALAVGLMWLIVLAAILTWDARLLFLVPLSQMLGLFGHLRFEPSSVDPRDTIFSWRALASLHRLTWSFFTGRYFDELKLYQQQFEEYRRGQHVTEDYRSPLAAQSQAPVDTQV